MPLKTIEEECTYLNALNPRQREAVLHFGNPLLILAGAGSGKTRVITTKIAYLVDYKGFTPESIMAVAFTNKAADEMRERVRALYPRTEGASIKTFHSFGAWLLRRHAHLLGLPEYFTIYDEEDSRSLLKSIFEEKIPLPELKDLYRKISRAKDYCLWPHDDLSAFDLVSPRAGLDFSDIYRLYNEKLRRTGNVDFGDLIMLSVKLLKDFPQVRQRIKQRFRVILVDEYQDSNVAQFMLLKELYGSNYLCVVGDEDQSIYGFRGAEVRNILSFSNAFPHTTIIRLEENYRSTQNILEVAASVVDHNVNRLGKTLWTKNPAGAPVVSARLEDQTHEAQFCVDLLKDGNYRDTAILYRMNFQSRVFETMFQRLGIPYRVVGTLKFYEREEVKDALAYMALLANPKNEIAFCRVVNKPRRGIGAKSLKKILENRDKAGSDLLNSCKLSLPSLSAGAASGVRGFLAIMESLKAELSRAPLSGLVNALILETGLYEYYREREGMAGSGKMENLEELINAASEYPVGLEGLCFFLESIGLNSSDENPYRRTNQVNLITVHNTKGLEFDRVIITGLEDGIFPHYTKTVSGLPLQGDDLEEERRLFYVGVTRARESLYLTSCRKRTVFGSLKKSEPSQFLKEIPKEHLCIYGASSEEDEFPLGCAVYHDDYGTGIITRKWYEEDRKAVIVRFDSGKSARFILRYSSLERTSREP